MAIVKQSFISNIIGRDTYDEFKGYAKAFIAIGTCILAVTFLLSLFFHWGFISNLLSIFTGTSLLFIAYIAALVLVLDIEVDVDEPEKSYWSEPERKPVPTAYKFTIVWGVVLIALGVSAIYYSNLYRKNYAFECSTFLVDQNAGIYHLDCYNKCEDAAQAFELEKMKGFQIDDSYTFCEWCKEWAEDAEADFEYHRYFRK